MGLRTALALAAVLWLLIFLGFNEMRARDLRGELPMMPWSSAR